MNSIKHFILFGGVAFAAAFCLYYVAALLFSLPNPVIGALGTGIGTGLVNGIAAAWTLR